MTPLIRIALFASFVVLTAGCGCGKKPVVTPPETIDAGIVETQDGGAQLLDGGVAIRFIAVGDTGKGNQNQQDVANAMAAKCAATGCDFVVMLGDNFYPSGVSSVDDPQFQTKFEDVYAGIHAPFWVVLGNHDYGGNGAGNEFSKGQYEVDYSQKSAKWKLPSKSWHQVFGDAELFAMDTNMQMYGQDDQQRKDVKAWIDASTAKWKISLGHHPYKSNGEHGNAGKYDGLSWVPVANGSGVKSFFEDVVCDHVDLSLSGHDHSRQWLSDKCGKTELVVSGGGADITALPGTQPALFQASSGGFLYVTVTANTLAADFIGPDGGVEFHRELTK